MDEERRVNEKPFFIFAALILMPTLFVLLFAGSGKYTTTVMWWLYVFPFGYVYVVYSELVRAFPKSTFLVRLSVLGYLVGIVFCAGFALIYVALRMLGMPDDEDWRWSALGAAVFVVFFVAMIYDDLVGIPRPWLDKKKDEDAEPEAVAPLSDDYLAWIKNHVPSLPEPLKGKYIESAKALVAKYIEERESSTNPLFQARAKAENSPPVEDAQVALFETYKKLAEMGAPQGDGYAPFPLFPPAYAKTRPIVNELKSLNWLQPWGPVIVPEADRIKAYVFGEDLYLSDTLFAPLIAQLEAPRDGAKRFESTFILAPTGSGKTTLLNYLIEQDFPYVARGEASIIAMDSTGDFLRGHIQLPFFHPKRGPQKDRLIIIEPDVERPLALNPFAYGRQRMKGKGEREREKTANTTIDLMAHAFATMGDGAKFTPRQGLVFRQCVRLCLAIPDANLATFAEIVSTASVDKYQEYVETLDDAAMSFFQNDFRTQDIQKVCKTELSWRVNALLENSTFARMMNAPDCKVDFFEALARGSFILINTDRDLLGDDRSAIFGRLMIALIRIAMRERDPLPDGQRKPVYFYIDEAHEYLDNDNTVASMIDDVRKSRLAMTFVTQRLAKIKDGNVKDALLSAGILLARPTADDRSTIEKYMGEKELGSLDNSPRTYYLFSRGVTRATTVQVPFIKVDTSRNLTESEQKETRFQVWQKYGYTPSKEPKKAEKVKEPEKPEKKKVKRL